MTNIIVTESRGNYTSKVPMQQNCQAGKDGKKGVRNMQGILLKAQGSWQDEWKQAMWGAEISLLWGDNNSTEQ